MGSKRGYSRQDRRPPASTPRRALRFDGDDKRILRLGLSVANRRKKFFLSRHATRKSSRHQTLTRPAVKNFLPTATMQ